MTELELLRRHPILRLAGSAKLDVVAQASRTRHFARGDLVVQPKFPHTGIYVLAEGVFEVTRRNRESDAEVLIGIMEAPGVFGDAELHAGKTEWSVTVRAAQSASAVLVPNNVFLEFVRTEPLVAAALYSDAAARLMLALELMQVFALQKVEHKILRLLYRVSQPADGNGHRVAPLSQVRLSRALGVNVKTISRHLNSLQKKGVIRREENLVHLFATEEGAFGRAIERPGLAAQWRLPTAIEPKIQ